MPHEKLKREDYLNMGGISTKSSPYVTGPHQFLNLVNWDFSTPGSLTKRPGSTQYVGSSFSGKITGLFEYEQTTGYSAVIFGTGSSMWHLNNNTLTGLTLPLNASATFRIEHRIALAQENWFNVSGNANATLYTGTTYTYIMPISYGSGIKDMVTYNNKLYLADGSGIFKISGTEVLRFGIPPVSAGGSFVVGVDTSTNINNAGPRLGQDYVGAAAYVNMDGEIGPATPILKFQSNGASYVVLGGVTYNTFTMGCTLPVPLGYGISYIMTFWKNDSTFNTQFFAGITSPIDAGGTFCDANWFVMSRFAKGANGITYPTLTGPLISENPVSPLLGVTVPYAADSYGIEGIRYPSFLETYNNQLFLGGFTASPSTVWFSDIGRPEFFAPENFVEVRTNDGDKLTAMKSYNSRLYLWKFGSMHEFSGDDPTNFALRELSDQYGCINNRCTAIFNDTMFFLDRKGIMEFNGANLQSISNDIQPIIDRISIESAKTEACMIHNPAGNQVMCAVPVDGATMNNLTMVYDYLLKAWTTYEGYNPAMFALMKGRLGTRGVFYGGYSGLIFNFGASLMGDNGTGFTCLIKTRYLSDLGQSVQKQFRRLYLNVDVQSGQTIAVTVKGYPDYQTGASLSSVMYLTQFQKRLEFGVSAKSMAFEMSHFSTTQGIRLHGWAVESRFQRNV